MESHLKRTLLRWLKNNPLVFQYRLDNHDLSLKEIYSQKEIRFDIRSVKQHRLREHPQGLSDYLNLVFDDGREIVLCHAGLAFSPCFINTGPLEDAPPVACLQDYDKLVGELKALLAFPDRWQETLALFNVLLSILDGARAVGLNISEREEALDKLLGEFEKGFSGKRQ